jgi:hypothetical protein
VAEQTELSPTAEGAEGRRPEVILDVRFEEGLLFLVVANTGERPAHGVSCTFDRSFRGLGGEREVSTLPLFRRLELLAPGREIATLLDTSAAYFARGEPTELTVKVAYHDPEGRSYESAIRHDLSVFRELAYVPKEVAQDA